MQGKITLEDHFATKTTLGDSHIFGAHVWSELGPRLLDFQDQRLRFMDAAGIEIMIASLNAPAIQAIPDIKRATEVTREANDVLAREIAKRPDRFVGVAALAMQDPDNAAAELERCVKDLGFRGALVNGFSQVGSPDTGCITICRNTGRSGEWSNGSTFHSICIRAILCRDRCAVTKDTTGCSDRTGRSMPRPRCTRCG